MPFDQSFQRGQGVGPPPPSLGSDPNPSTLTGAAATAYATRDNCFTFQLQEAGPQPLHLALAAAFAGSGTPGQVTIALYLFDATQTGTWLVLSSATLTVGEVIVVDVPVVMSVLSQSWTVALVPTVASPTTGIYTFEAGLSESAVTVAEGAPPTTVIANQGAPTADTTAAAWPVIEANSSYGACWDGTAEPGSPPAAPLAPNWAVGGSAVATGAVQMVAGSAARCMSGGHVNAVPAPSGAQGATTTDGGGNIWLGLGPFKNGIVLRNTDPPDGNGLYWNFFSDQAGGFLIAGGAAMSIPVSDPSLIYVWPATVAVGWTAAGAS